MNTTESLTSALEAIEKLDAVEIVGEFRAFEHSCTPGSYCALVLNPATGETHTVNEASWSCSTDEYFGESGVLSRTTLLSSTRAHWSPSPDDGFEWTDGDDYAHPKGAPSGWVADFDEAARAAVAEKLGIDLEAAEIEVGDAKYVLAALGWEFFSISETPVNGWVPDGNSDHSVREVQKQLEELATAIREEIEKSETTES
jgi:hypothetical protein